LPSGDRWQFSADGCCHAPRSCWCSADDPDHIYTDDGIRLPGGLTHPLLADPNLYAVVTNSLGEPLDLGRQVRLATAAQRRAIRIRDGGCIFPGCDHPVQHCDVHHVIPWDDQGPTNLRLLAAGCRHHHRIWHRHGWIMRATPDAWFWWQTPAGRTFWSQRHGRQRPDPPPPPILIAPPASRTHNPPPRPSRGEPARSTPDGRPRHGARSEPAESTASRTFFPHLPATGLTRHRPPVERGWLGRRRCASPDPCRTPPSGPVAPRHVGVSLMRFASNG
jgi:hypothetical protein